MNKWHYIEQDGNPTENGYYEVDIEQEVTYADRWWSDDPNKTNKIHACEYDTTIGVCYWSNDKKEWYYNSCSLSIGGDESQLCESDHIYAWANVLLNAPKMIYPSRKIEIDPSEYHLTESQLKDFLNDYKLSYERGDAIE